MSDNLLARRLRASVQHDAVNGNDHERSVCKDQMWKAAEMIDSMKKKIDDGVLLDTKRLDWLEAMMTPADDFCEVFFAGLRTSISQPATSFQIESNPEKFPTTQRATLRECIDAVLQPNMEDSRR